MSPGPPSRPGFAAIAVMDHLLQIPQVGRVWDPIPEAYVTLGFLAGVTERVDLGALVTPVTFRSAPLLAKILASLDAVSGGRAFCGLGAGWYEREHAAYALPFPPRRRPARRAGVDHRRPARVLGSGHQTVQRTARRRPPATRAPARSRSWSAAAASAGHCGSPPGSADGCNLGSSLTALDRKLEVFREHAGRAGRPLDELRVTVLDLPIVGGTTRTRSPGWSRRIAAASSAKAYAAAHHAGHRRAAGRPVPGAGRARRATRCSSACPT